MKYARKFVNQLLLASLIIVTSFSIADAQRGGGSRGGGGGRSFGGGGGGGHSFAGGGGSRPSFGGGGGGSRPGYGGGNHFNGGGNFRGGFGGGNRVVAAPHYAPGRVIGGVRGSVNIGIGRNYAYRGGYYNRPYYGGGYYGGSRFGFGAYYNGYFPHIGFRLNILPYGYYPFYYGGYPYYYNEGLFYQPYADGGYQVVAPPVGADVPNLPAGAQEIAIDGNQFFQKDGIYYQPVTDENGRRVYRVAGKDGVLNTQNGQQLYDPAYQQQQQQQPQGYPAPNNNGGNYNALPQVGDVVNALPDGSTKVKINGQRLFVSPDGVYYQQDNSGSSPMYRVVGVPNGDDSADAIDN